MIGDYRVVVFTPWGRELTGSILYEYLKRDHLAGAVDEWHLWMNTDANQISDVEYAYDLEQDNDWISVKERPVEEFLQPKQLNTGKFYVYNQDEKTIYVRMDDDIVYVEPNAIARLVEARIENPFPFVVFPIIWNNAVVSYYLQQMQAMPSWWGVVGNHCMDPLGWGDGHFANNIHQHLLAHIEMDKVQDLFLHHSIQLMTGQQFSVSSFAQFGSEYKKTDGIVNGEEESWHTIKKPYELQRPNMIVPNSLVSHFSFYHQRDFLLGSTNILERYRNLANDLHS